MLDKRSRERELLQVLLWYVRESSGDDVAHMLLSQYKEIG